MPIVEKLWNALRSRYGPKEGERVYYAMEAEGKGPFSEKGKYRELHEKRTAELGVTPLPDKKKPAARGGKRRAKARSRGRR